MKTQITNIAGYLFTKINDVERTHKKVQGVCDQTHLKGTVFISNEGVNLSLAGNQTDIEFVVDQLNTVCGFKHLLLSTTYSETIPFQRLLVKTCDELVATRRKPDKGNKALSSTKLNNVVQTSYGESSNSPMYITSAALKQWLDNDMDFTLLDLRNSFEYKLGSFCHAKHLGIKHFRELENSNNKLNDIPKNQPVVAFCTGGIRCEKGANFIAQQGFDQVYQLKGGVLDYLNKYKGSYWRGDCFVFDDRVSLNHELSPTYTKLCRNCQASLLENEEKFCSACACVV